VGKDAGMTAASDPTDDLDLLFDVAVGLARQQLEAQGACLPFALALTTDGEPVSLAVQPGEDPDALDLEIACLEALQARRAGLRATARVVDEVAAGGACLRVELELVGGRAQRVHVPYEVTADELTWGAPEVAEVAPAVWCD
jgi:hypothetical protein